MAKGKSTWKYNKLLTARRNYFALGSVMDNNNPLAGYGGNPFDTRGYMDNIHSYRGDLKATQKFVNNAYNNGNPINTNTGSLGADALTNQIQTPKGDTGNGTPWGAIGGLATAATSDIIGIFNAKNEVKQRANSMIANVKAQTMSAQAINDSLDALNEDWKNQTQIANVTKNQLGALNNTGVLGNAFAQAAEGAAAGSGLGPWGIAGGATGGLVSSLISSAIRNREAKKQARRVNETIADVNAFNERSLLNRGDNIMNDTMSNLRANTAAFGGELNTNGADWTNGLLTINAGGSHETNPYEGVLMGMDQEGTPNLVEEGETIFNDYVFSKRLKVPKAIRNKYKLSNKRPISFADASKKLAEESEERPNDPISKRGLEALMADLAQSQEELKMKQQRNELANRIPVDETNYSAYGGKVNRFVGGGVKNVKNKMGLSQNDVWSFVGYKSIKEALKRIKSMPDGPEKKKAAREFFTKANEIQRSYYNSVYGKTEWDKPAVSGGKEHQMLWNSAGLDLPIDYRYENTDGESYTLSDLLSLPSNGQLDDWIGNHTLIKNLGLSKDYEDLKDYFDNINNLATELGWSFTPSTEEGNPMMWFNELNGDITDLSTSTDQTAGRDFFKGLTGLGYNSDEANYIIDRLHMNDGILSFEDYDESEFPYYADEYKRLYPKERTVKYNNGETVTAERINSNNEPVLQDDEKTEVKDRDLNNITDTRGLPTWMRYAPILGASLGVGMDLLGLTNKPNYSDANAVLDATRDAGTYKPVRFNPIGNYLTYRPFDQQYAINNLNAQAAGNRRALLQNAGLNRGQGMAGILAADYNAQNSLGDLYSKAAAYNEELKKNVETFNRETNKTNSEGMLTADMANQKTLAGLAEFRLKGALAAAELRQKERLAAEAGRSANLTNLFQGIGDIGYENFNMNMANSVSPYYRIGSNGVTYYTNEYFNKSPEERALIDAEFNKKYIKPTIGKNSNAASNNNTNIGAFGGPLTYKPKKKRR